MALVDLRAREGDPAVLAIVGPDAPDSPPHLGWEEDGELVVCVRLTRRSADVLRLEALDVLASADRAAVGPAFVAALTAVATASRVEVEAPESDQPWLERCGFRVETSGLYAIDLRPTPAPPELVAATTLTELEAVIAAAWGIDTTDDPEEWSAENPARGQCDVTALVVRDLLGGDILIANVLREGKRIERHAWNRLPSGLTLDLTRSQFLHGETFEEPVVQEPLAVAAAPERYDRLARRVRAALESKAAT